MRIGLKASLLTASLPLLIGLASPSHADNMGLWGAWSDSDSYLGPRGDSSAPSYNYAPSGEAFPRIMDGGGKPFIEPQAPKLVYFPSKEAPGTILIDTAGKRLYYIVNTEEAYDYPISVGREGFTWTGTEKISRVQEWPDWHPPKEMLERDPKLPELMYGGIKNPLGAVALFLGNSLYRIHGTNDPKTIGQAASSGCFRMMNEHALHLASIAKIGTVVKVLPSLAAPDPVAELPWLKKPTALGGFGTTRPERKAQPQVSGWEAQVSGQASSRKPQVNGWTAQLRDEAEEPVVTCAPGLGC